MIHEDRIEKFGAQASTDDGDYVLYWMQTAQRIKDNHALEFAIRLANKYACPLVVLFVVMPDYPDANTRHFTFMLQGIKEIQSTFDEMGAGFFIRIGNPLEEALKFTQKAKAVVMERGYSLFERKLRDDVIDAARKTIYIIETNLVVPVEKAYAKEAYAAYAIRPTIMRSWHAYLDETDECVIDNAYSMTEIRLRIEDVQHFIEEYLPKLELVQPSNLFLGGEKEANKWLQDFIDNKLENYSENSSDPSNMGSSHLSPYLHFGQISPITILKKVLASGLNADGFVEQLLVRRELAYNTMFYAGEALPELSRILPSWAMESLAAHRHDTRPYVYDLKALEQALTHDVYWNAAQLEMVITGHMQGTMRMYWGKKVLEWTSSPEEAYEILRYLNDKYELDGRDPSGYVGIAWCFGKHDRAWKEREIFGKTRYMNAAGLERKYDILRYVAYVKDLEGAKIEKES